MEKIIISEFTHNVWPILYTTTIYDRNSKLKIYQNNNIPFMFFEFLSTSIGHVKIYLESTENEENLGKHWNFSKKKHDSKINEMKINYSKWKENIFFILTISIVKITKTSS